MATFLFKSTKKKIKTSYFVDTTIDHVKSGSKRIGKINDFIETTIDVSPASFDFEGNNPIGVQVTKNIRLFGDPRRNIIMYDIDSFRFGKDLKTIKNLLNDKLLLNITLGKENDITADNIIDHDLEVVNHGQNNLFNTFDIKNQKFIFFNDIEGKPSPESFIGKTDAQKQGFPFVYDSKNDYPKFRSPDASSLDGSIDIFNFKEHPSTGRISDIQLKGARGLFGFGDWEISQNTTAGKKGSVLIDHKYEIKKSPHSYFEDSSELIISSSFLNGTGSLNRGSLQNLGYVSDTVYKISPFVEENKFNNQYSFMTPVDRDNLIHSASMEDFELGVRFKSRENGFIMTPFYQTTEQRSFGTDSIAFSGLLKR